MARPNKGEFLPLPTNTKDAAMGWGVTGDPGPQGIPGFFIIVILFLLILAFFNRAKLGLKFGRKSK